MIILALKLACHSLSFIVLQEKINLSIINENLLRINTDSQSSPLAWVNFHKERKCRLIEAISDYEFLLLSDFFTLDLDLCPAEPFWCSRAPPIVEVNFKIDRVNKIEAVKVWIFSSFHGCLLEAAFLFCRKQPLLLRGHPSDLYSDGQCIAYPYWVLDVDIIRISFLESLRSFLFGNDRIVRSILMLDKSRPRAWQVLDQSLYGDRLGPRKGQKGALILDGSERKFQLSIWPLKGVSLPREENLGLELWKSGMLHETQAVWFRSVIEDNIGWSY